MLLYDAHARAYTSKRNHFLEFWRIGREFGFFEKKTYVHVKLSQLKRIPDGQKCKWCYFRVNIAEKQHCCFCCYFSNTLSNNSKFQPSHTKWGQIFDGEAEISAKISAGGAQQQMLLKYIAIWCARARSYVKAKSIFWIFKNRPEIWIFSKTELWSR